jgi:chitinase
VKRPSCSKGGNSVGRRNIGYYESWANTRACQNVAPEDLNLDGFTSINFAFAFFDPNSFTITSMDSNAASLYSRFTALKQKKPGLQTWISVGGWSFTDPGSTQKAFSNMASSASNRAAFINGLVHFMDTYGFDGVDIDWEYPGADDRGGVGADTANYVALTKQMREAFGSKYGLTVTIPTSYWYLQHFDLPGIEANIDWFNLMAYDLHGTWDAQSKYVGPYIAPHTNITEIDGALDLLWRAGVDSQKVVMGQGWYGRSFTLKDPSCNTPNGQCQFTGGANPGPCSKASGILDYEEIADIITQNKLKPTWNKDAAVKWITWDSNQWVSYDDGDTFKQKRDFANSRCLGGLMVWAMDQVDQKANNGFGGAAAAAGADVTSSQQSDADSKSGDMLAGLKCYVSDCNAGCKAGTNEVAEFNGQPGQISTNQRCSKKTYRSLCCDSTTHMGTCQWRGYRGAGLGCIKGCAEGETELTTNTNQHEAKKGDKNCHGGLQSFCCADFKPTSSSLSNDLKDAAKAAAEAAAEQAALDIAAKAFCRVAVPALLAPLELLEDIIPIVGEILDAVEIAATPAIIEGCVKGIEKEGKAEFKVFGKEHTLSVDLPKTKPTTVPDRPPAKGDNPSKTGDKNDKCQREVKRALPPVETTYIDTPRMQRLLASSGRPRDYAWRQNDGYALRIMYPRKNTLNLIPTHYGIVAGYVSRSLGKVQSERDDCGKVVKRTQEVRRDWRSNGYDLILNEHDVMLQGGPEDAEGNEIPNQGAYGMDWIGTNFDKPYIVWQNLGPIRPGVTYADTIDEANAYIDKYPKYNVITNNCYHFANALYAWMK